MKSFCWNCHGLGAPRAVRAVHKLINNLHQNFVFLMETKLKVREVEKLNDKLGFKNAIWVDCSGDGRRRAGGMRLLWDEDMVVGLLSYSTNHIDVKMSEVKEGKN